MAEVIHCMYYVRRKRRYCRMTVKRGKRYCGEHQQYSLDTTNSMEEDAQDKRVKCPLDPTHTCYQSKLPKHLTVCNAKRMLDDQPAFIEKGINLNEVPEVPEHVPLSELNQTVIDTVLSKVHAAYEKLPQFPETVMQHDVLRNIIDDESSGKAARKHLLQNSSLLAHLEHSGLVTDNTCFIEFGAGKGKLTYWLGQMVKDKKDSCILLVDRSSHRHKSDNKLKNERSSLLIKRVKADIADLKLNNITEIQKFKYKVGIAKHLCGSATDLTIRCLVKAMQNEPICNVTGLVIAFCCHHRCEYASYVGKHYLENCGFTPNEFTILCSIASWATCGSGLSRIIKIQNDKNGSKGAREDMETLERECVGRKVKSLLNWGRLEFLRNFGFHNNLLYYTTTDVSLENMCIIATRPHPE